MDKDKVNYKKRKLLHQIILEITMEYQRRLIPYADRWEYYCRNFVLSVVKSLHLFNEYK
jgi:hypothetical protein